MKVKHTRNGNVKAVMSLEEAEYLNGLMTGIRCDCKPSAEQLAVAQKLEDGLDAADVDYNA